MPLLEFKLVPTHCNRWPCFFVEHNGKLIYSKEISTPETVSLTLEDSDDNHISFGINNKQFGAENVWDTQTDSAGKIVQDLTLTIESATLEAVDVLDLILKQPYQLDKTFGQEHIGKEIVSDGTINFNGFFTLDYSSPYLNSITNQKWKQPVQQQSYYSNSTTLFHYEKDLELIDEIYDIIEQAKQFSNQRT